MTWPKGYKITPKKGIIRHPKFKVGDMITDGRVIYTVYDCSESLGEYELDAYDIIDKYVYFRTIEDIDSLFELYQIINYNVIYSKTIQAQ